MNQIYRWLGTTRQNMHQRLNRALKGAEEKEQLKVILFQVREDHPQMGCKALYRKVNPQTMGRDKFFEFYRSYGFRIAPKKSFKRTTDSTGVIRFPNLVTGRELTGVNQVWVSDITYYEMNGTGWGTPFLLVPEATNVDEHTLHQLTTAKPTDYFLSWASPLGTVSASAAPSWLTALARMQARIGSPAARASLSRRRTTTPAPSPRT